MLTRSHRHYMPYSIQCVQLQVCRLEMRQDSRIFFNEFSAHILSVMSPPIKKFRNLATMNLSFTLSLSLSLSLPPSLSLSPPLSLSLSFTLSLFFLQEKGNKFQQTCWDSGKFTFSMLTFPPFFWKLNKVGNQSVRLIQQTQSRLWCTLLKKSKN